MSFVIDGNQINFLEFWLFSNFKRVSWMFFFFWFFFIFGQLFLFKQTRNVQTLVLSRRIDNRSLFVFLLSILFDLIVKFSSTQRFLLFFLFTKLTPWNISVEMRLNNVDCEMSEMISKINANDLKIHEQYLCQPMTSKLNIRAMQWFDAATSKFDANYSCGTEYPNNLCYTFLALLQLTSLELEKLLRFLSINFGIRLSAEFSFYVVLLSI